MASSDPKIVPLHNFRMENLTRWHIVEATCFRCRHTEKVPHDRLWRGRTQHDRIKDLGQRLRCKQCGNRTNNALSVRIMPRD